MVPIQTKPCVTITERIDRIRLRAYLEKVSGVSATDKEAFLEICRRYEQNRQSEYIIRHPLGEWGQFDKWNKFEDWNKFEGWSM